MTVSANSPTWSGGAVSKIVKFSTTGHTRTSMGWKANNLQFSGTTGDVVTLTYTDQSGSACGMALDGATVKGK